MVFNFKQHINGALDILFSEVFGFKQTDLGPLKGWIALGFFGCFAVSNMAQLVKCFAYHKNVTCGTIKSVLTDTDSKVCTFRSLWMCPIFSCTFQEFSPFPVTVQPPYFSIKLTKGVIPRLLIAAVFTQEL